MDHRAVIVLCVALSGWGCDSGNSTGPSTVQAPPPPPPPPPDPSDEFPPPTADKSEWVVTSVPGSATGTACALRDEHVTWSRAIEAGEGLALEMFRSADRVWLVQGWALVGGPFDDVGRLYGGRLVGRDFTTTSTRWEVFRCSDGTVIGNTQCRHEVTGQFSPDERTFTATRRQTCRNENDVDVLTVSWRWSATRR